MADAQPAVSLDGNVEYRVLSNFTGSLTVTAWSAGTDITCDVIGAGLSPDTSEETFTVDRACSAQTADAPSTTKSTIEAQFAYDPQGDETANVGLTALTPRTEKYIAAREGIPHGTAGAADQKVTVYRVKVGAHRKVAAARNEESRKAVTLYVQPDGETEVSLATA